MDAQDIWLVFWLVLPMLVVEPYAAAAAMAAVIDWLDPCCCCCCIWLGRSDSDSDERASASGLRRNGLESCRLSPPALPKRTLSPNLGDDSTDRCEEPRLFGRPILPGIES